MIVTVRQLRAPLERDSFLRQQARVLRGRTLPLILRRRENHQTKDVIKQILARLLAVESCWPCLSVIARRSHTADARLTPFPVLTPPLHECAQVVEIATLIVLGTALACPPFAWLLRACVLPKPGQGPSDATMDAGFLR